MAGERVEEVQDPECREMRVALRAIEEKLHFVMQTLSLTRQLPNGTQESRSLTALFEEMKAHDGTTSQTFADVAKRAFASPGDSEKSSESSGPDGFSGTTRYDHPSAP